MILGRREPADRWEKLRVTLWPRRSFWRSFRYYGKRALRLSATPHAIALGVSLGVFASFLPYMGLHFILAAVMAWALGGNVVASAIGTALGNPLTFPFIWAGTLGLGRLILYGGQPAAAAPLDLMGALSRLSFDQVWHPLLLPMTVGGVVLGLAVAPIFYFGTRYAATAFTERRRRRLASARNYASAISGEVARP